ncbi:MAG: isoprenyl transferase [Bacteroidales bacterium]|nr:isoprenyl transferase [Bacteroidales bacterium]
MDEQLQNIISQIDSSRLPQHVAVIMDGNGRWAKSRGLDRSMGHAEGVNAVRRITEIASDLGIRYLTLYTFSTENWNRPQAEVDSLMHLIAYAIEQQTPDLIKNNVRLNIIGDLSRVPEFALSRLQHCMEQTASDTGLTMSLAISYSARAEIVDAVRRLAADVAKGEVNAADIDADTFASRLATAGMPDPDLLIRTGGECRISNYLLWQIAYAELYFSPVLWPDFSKTDFCNIIKQYQTRERRFGLTGEQIKNKQ